MKPDIFKQHKVIVSFLSVALAAILWICAMYYSEYTKYSSLNLSEQTVAKIELVSYFGEPFSSDIKDRKIFTDESTLSIMTDTLRTGRVSLTKPFECRYALKITFSDNSSIVAFYAKRKLGFLYKSVWIDAEGIAEVFDFCFR